MLIELIMSNYTCLSVKGGGGIITWIYYHLLALRGNLVVCTGCLGDMIEGNRLTWLLFIVFTFLLYLIEECII